jgi:hypothetical protein
LPCMLLAAWFLCHLGMHVFMPTRTRCFHVHMWHTNVLRMRNYGSELLTGETNGKAGSIPGWMPMLAFLPSRYVLCPHPLFLYAYVAHQRLHMHTYVCVCIYIFNIRSALIRMCINIYVYVFFSAFVCMLCVHLYRYMFHVYIYMCVCVRVRACRSNSHGYIHAPGRSCITILMCLRQLL